MLQIRRIDFLFEFVPWVICFLG